MRIEEKIELSYHVVLTMYVQNKNFLEKYMAREKHTFLPVGYSAEMACEVAKLNALYNEYDKIHYNEPEVDDILFRGACRMTNEIIDLEEKAMEIYFKELEEK